MDPRKYRPVWPAVLTKQTDGNPAGPFDEHVPAQHLFVLRLLGAVGIEGWHVAGGFMRPKEGLKQPHYWLENGGTILDLTADQFGWEPVILSTEPDERYEASKDMSKKSRVTTLLATVRQWEGSGASFWQENDPPSLE